MKPQLQTSLGQHLVMTPQLQQAIRLLQLSSVELEAEIAKAVESNPLLDWVETGSDAALTGENERSDPTRESIQADSGDANSDRDTAASDTPEQRRNNDDDDPWLAAVSQGRAGNGQAQADAEQLVETDSLHDHLLWQLHLSHLSPRDRQAGVAVIEAIDDDGYLRGGLDAVSATLAPDIVLDDDELATVLHQIQRFDPPGVAARDLGECLRLQLALLASDTAGKVIATQLTGEPLQRLPKTDAERLARELGHTTDDIQTGIHLLRSLDPRPGARFGAIPADTYIKPDVTIWREHGIWQVRLASGSQPRVAIQHTYERMIEHAGKPDADYLRGHLQEARWLLKNIHARGETLLKVMTCLLRQQSAFLEFGDQALRPLTLREVASEVGLHESTVSRAISRKYAHTPRGTIALRDFFASGVGNGNGGEASSTAIQAMLRHLIDEENPRAPLSDARLSETLKSAGIAVARRTVAKYREAMGIATSQDRVRMK